MKGKLKSRLPHLRPAHPHLRVRGWFLSENAAMPPGQQVKVHKSAELELEKAAVTLSKPHGPTHQVVLRKRIKPDS